MKYTVRLVSKKRGDDLCAHVADEEDLFVIDENGRWWLASEFFYMNDVEEFTDEV